MPESSVRSRLRTMPCPRCGDGIGAPLLVTGDTLCPACVERLVAMHTPASRTMPSCSRCGTDVAESAIQRCHLTETPYCMACAVRCVECDQVTQRDLLRPNPSGRGMVCPDHLQACATCDEAELPRQMFECPSCEKRHCQRDASRCPSCETPACRRCTRTLEDHCRACARLKPVPAHHPHVELVRTLYPHLARGQRTWRWSKAGEYALIEWKRPLGSWGRVVLNIQDHLSVAAYEVGILSAWWSRIRTYYGFAGEAVSR